MSIVLTLAHSPDPDDAFMWWPLLELDGAPPAIDTGEFSFSVVAQDIEALNARAEEAGDLDITAMSCAQYPRVQDRYVLTACGASLGDGYGPKLVSAQPMSTDALAVSGGPVAVPGMRTSALGTMRLLFGSRMPAVESADFAQIGELVAAGRYPAGIVIHEGQLTFKELGLHLVADLGAWWMQRTGLPLPLGVNAIARDLDDRFGPGTMERVAVLLRESVTHALADRERSIRYAMQFGRGLDAATVDAFVRLYVNRWTLDFGGDGRAAVRCFLGELAEIGAVPAAREIEFIGSAAADSAP